MGYNRVVEANGLRAFSISRTVVPQLYIVAGNIPPSSRINVRSVGLDNHGKSARGYFAMVMTSEERFWSKVAKTDGCWLWTAGLTAKGYGSFCINGKNTRAHRFSWGLTHGPIPKGINVCHKCDATYPVGDITYRRCVRPDHLFLGTQLENMHDRDRKGRGNWEKAVTTVTKFSDELRHEIWMRYRTERISQDKLAAIYGMCQRSVSLIVRGRRSGDHKT